MTKAKKAAIAALACTVVLGAGTAVFTGCKENTPPPVTVHDDIVNGGFEEGNLTGWKAGGDYAFDAEGVVDTEKAEGLDFTVGGKVGTYYFNGLAATNSTSTGTLTSEPFKLSGTGKIGFKIGSGSDKEKCYVEFIEHGTDTVLKKVGNEAYLKGFIDDDLVRVVVDLSEHIGKEIYIKVTDNGSAQKSAEYVHLDDFVMYKTEADVTAANAERNDYIRMNGKPVFENDTPTAKTVKNGNFEDGLNNWQVVEGDAYTPKSIAPASLTFWNPAREHNAEGSYFLNGYAVGEERTGAIRSTTFTLDETGIISFILTNSASHSIYVAVCNDEAIGDIAKDTELFKVYADEKIKDPVYTLNMLRRYINASKYTPEGGKEVSLIGKKLYVKLVDGASSGKFAAVNFDDVRCSMTREEVLELGLADYNWAMGLTDRGEEELKATRQYYETLNYPFGIAALRFVSKPASFAAKVNDEVDIESRLGKVKAVYADAAANEFEYKITKVEYDGKEITEGLNAVTLDKIGIVRITYQAKCLSDTSVEPISGTFAIDVISDNMIANGGFETGDMAGWTVKEGEVSVADAVSGAEYGFTGAPYNQGGKFHYDGASAAEESKTYTLKSTDFVLGGAGVISFKLGGCAATLRVYDVTSGGLLGEYKNTQWNDVENPHVEKGCRNLTMTSYYADLSDYIGLTLRIELADTETPIWGVMHVDDIVTYYEGETAAVLETLAAKEDTVKYTCEGGENTTTIPWVAAQNNIVPEIVQITDKVKAYHEFATAQTGIDLTQYIADIDGVVIGVKDPVFTKSIYKVSDGTTDYTTGFNSFNLAVGKTYKVTYVLTYNDGEQDYPAYEVFTIKVISANEIQNAGFETGDLTGWTYKQGTADGEIKGDAAICADETFWGERIPFNKSGSYFFNGWNAHEVEKEGYTLKSSVFTLGGSGFISFKMGGNAAVVKVYKADGTQIAQYSNTEFADIEFPHVEKGGRWATMTTFVADLHEHIGEQLYIELVDKGEAPWGVAFFDDIVTYYETAPVVADRADDVTVYCEDPAGTDYKMPWVKAENEYTA